MSSGSSPPAPESSKGKLNGLGKAFRNIDLDGHNLPPSPAPSSPRNGRKYALATELVYTEGNDQYNASSVPIYQVCSSPDRSISRYRMKRSSMGCSERMLKLFLYGLNVTDSPCHSLQPSSKSPQLVVQASMTIRGLETLLVRTLNDI